MKQFSRWTLFVTIAACLLFFAGGAFAAEVPNAANNYNLNPPTALGDAFKKSGQGWWDTMSFLGMWVCGIGGALMYMAGKPEYVRWAVVGLLIFAFGDLFANFILGLGGAPQTPAGGAGA
jgi:hypothetical protein